MGRLRWWWESSEGAPLDYSRIYGDDDSGLSVITVSNDLIAGKDFACDFTDGCWRYISNIIITRTIHQVNWATKTGKVHDECLWDCKCLLFSLQAAVSVSSSYFDRLFSPPFTSYACMTLETFFPEKKFVSLFPFSECSSVLNVVVVSDVSGIHFNLRTTSQDESVSWSQTKVSRFLTRSVLKQTTHLRTS